MSSLDMSGVEIARFSAGHISQVAEIERERFSEPWSQSSLALLCDESYPSFVLVSGQEVLGYVSTSRALCELEIINVAVRCGYERRGYATRLMEALDGYCAENGIESVSLEVRLSNGAARALYARHGYTEVGIRKGFYRFPTEDAVVMVKKYEN